MIKKNKITMNNNKHIWEGWTVKDFIDHLEVTFSFVTFRDKKDLKEWCKSEQPYYKKHIPEVYDYFLELALKFEKIDFPNN